METKSRMDKTNVIAEVFIIVGAVGLLLMTAIIGWQVYGRYVLNQSPDWSEQSALVLMIWYVCFASAAGVKEGFHIRIVAFENAASAKIAFVMRCISNLVICACGLAMAIWGTELVIGTWTHIVPTLGISRGAVYLALPISGFFIAFFSLEKLIQDKVNNVSSTQEDV